MPTEIAGLFLFAAWLYTQFDIRELEMVNKIDYAFYYASGWRLLYLKLFKISTLMLLLFCLKRQGLWQH